MARLSFLTNLDTKIIRDKIFSLPILFNIGSNFSQTIFCIQGNLPSPFTQTSLIGCYTGQIETNPFIRNIHITKTEITIYRTLGLHNKYIFISAFHGLVWDLKNRSYPNFAFINLSNRHSATRLCQ